MGAGERPRALVAGGGIAGLAAGVACARAGFEVQAFERTAAFAPIGAGIQLGPNATRVLQQWGLGDALARAASFPVRLVVRHAHRGREIGTLPLGQRAVQRYGAPYATVHRAELHRLLLDAFQSTPHTTLQFGRALDEFVQSADAVAVPSAVRQAEGLSADLLIGADGLWSAIRESLLADGPPQTTGHLAYRALLPQADLPPHLCNRDRVEVWLGRKLHVVAYPVRGGEWLNLVAIVHRQFPGNRLEARGWDLPTDAADLLAALGGVCPALEALVEAVPEWRLWVLYDRPPMRSAHEHGRGRVVLVGDAAHPMRPYLAQGAGMAIEDAAMLERALADQREQSVPDALRHFAQRRWRRNAQVQARARRNSDIFHASGPLAAARDWSLRLLGHRLLDLPWLYEHGQHAARENNRSRDAA